MRLARFCHNVSVLALGLALLACGGGGGSEPATSISVSASSLDFTAIQNGAAPASQSLSVSFKGDGVIIGYPPGVAPAGWLGVTTSGASGSSLSATVSVLTTRLDPGTYSTTLRFVSGKQDGSNLVHKDLAVRYTVRQGLVASATSLAFSTEEGLAAPDQTLALSATSGTFDWKLDVEAVNGQPTDWLRLSATRGTGNTGQVGVQVTAAPRAQGSYAATLVLLSGSDEVQARIPVRYVVSPCRGPVATTSALAFSALEGLAPQPQPLTLKSNAAPFEWKLRVEAVNGQPTDWLGLPAASGTSSTPELSLQITAAPRPRGSYAATLVLLNGADEVRSRIPVSYEPAPGYTLSGPLAWRLDQGARLADLELPLDLNPAWGSAVGSGFSWQIASDQPWLTVSPSAGSMGGPLRLAVRLSADQLWAKGSGTYGANLSLTVSGGAVGSVVVPASLQLSLAPALVLPAPGSFTLNNGTSPAELAGTLKITSNLGEAFGPHGAWTATSDAAWLRLTRAAGDAGSELSFRIDPASLAAPLVGTRSASLALSPLDSRLAPAQATVQLELSLSTVDTVSPRLAFTGHSGEAVLRGSGFARQPSLQVKVGGAALPCTVVDDTEIRLPLPAFATPQRLPVRISNGVGLELGGAELVVADVPAYAAGAFTSTTGFDRMTLDAERQAVWLHGWWNSEVRRCSYASGAWTTESLSQPNPTAVALSQDGRELFLVAGSGYTPKTVTRLDPASLAVKGVDTVSSFYESLTMAAGFNDGTTWLINGDQWGRILSYPLGESPAMPSIYSPQMVMSLDRSRIVLGSSGGISPADPAVHSCDANGKVFVPRTLAAGDFRDHLAGMSRDASRFVFRTSVYDRDFRLLGALLSPGEPAALAVAPDGRTVIAASGSPAVFHRYDISGGAGPFPPEPAPLPFSVAPDQGVTRMLVSEDGGTLFVLAANLAGTTFYVFPLS